MSGIPSRYETEKKEARGNEEKKEGEPARGLHIHLHLGVRDGDAGLLQEVGRDFFWNLCMFGGKGGR